MRKKILYYFLKYYHIVKKIFINNIINDINDIDTNSSIPFSLSDIDPMESYNILQINIPKTNIHNSIPKLNSSYAYSFASNNNNSINPLNWNDNKTERINSRIGDKNNMRHRKSFTYGNIKVNMNKENEDIKILENNNSMFNNSYSLINNNNSQTSRHVFPNYTFTTPNKYIYPIILNNNNNNNLNNNLLYQYPGNTIIYPNDSKSEQMKPLFWYTNETPSINQVSIMQDSNYLNSFQNQTPKYINNSAYFNSITNINNSYSEDYLNKQIFDFINANSKTKKNIIINIGKKHNIKLNKTKKTNTKEKKIKEKIEKNRKDKSLGKNRNKQMVFEKIKKKNYSEYHELNNNENENFQNEIVINKYKKNQKLKLIKENKMNKIKNNIPIGQKKKSNINNLKRNDIYLDKNKIIKNYSIEISNSTQLINNNDFIYENNSQNNINNHMIDKYKNKNIKNIDNSLDKAEDEQNNSNNENLEMTLQSMNDSKMLEMANLFVEGDMNLNKDKIVEILNEKNIQKNIRINK